MGEILKNLQIFHIFAFNSLLIASGSYFFPNLTTNVFVIILPGFHTSKECKSSELLVERAANPTSYKRIFTVKNVRLQIASFFAYLLPFLLY